MSSSSISISKEKRWKLGFEKLIGGPPGPDISWAGSSNQLGVSKNRGTPKWMVYNGKPQWLLGTTILGTPQLGMIRTTLPATNFLHLKNGLEDDCFLLGWLNIAGANC